MAGSVKLLFHPLPLNAQLRVVALSAILRPRSHYGRRATYRCNWSSVHRATVRGMSRRFALFVDAGYLIAAGGWAVTGKYRRNESECRSLELVSWLIERASTTQAPRELLRLYWYDAAPNRMATSEQLAIADHADTKVRLGHLTAQGTQKGVDALLLSDLTTLARERSIDTAVVLAGDGDFVEAVSQAQRHGTRVELWAIATPQNTLSPDLRREADRVDMLTATDLDRFFSPAPPRPQRAPEGSGSSSTKPVMAPVGGNDLPVYATIITDDAIQIGRAFAQQWAALVSSGERANVLAGEPRLPGDLDFRLIRYAIEAAELTPETRLAPDALRAIREGFWAGLAALND